MDQFFKLGNKQRPIRFGYGAIYQFEKKTGESVLALLDDISKGNIRLSAVIDLTWAGLVNGAKASGLRVDFTPDDVAQWFDEIDGDFIEKILQHFAASFPSAPASENGQAVGMEADKVGE